MGILNLGGSDEFEELEEFEYSEFSDYDELEVEDAGTGFRGKRLIAIFVAGLFTLVGTTFGARVILNSGTGLEYGQGFKATVGCQDTPLTVTPLAGFLNENGGAFILDSIYIEGISDKCNGRDFVVDVFSNTDSTPLTVDESATSTSPSYVYKPFNTTRFYYQDSSTVISRTNAYTWFDVATDTSTGSTDTTGSLQIVFDPDPGSNNFARATNVYKITVETQVPNAVKD